MTPAEQVLAERIDRDLAFLAPERSVGEYLIEKGYVEVAEEEPSVAELVDQWNMDGIIDVARRVASEACPSPSAAGREDRCGMFSFPKRCTPGACTMTDVVR